MEPKYNQRAKEVLIAISKESPNLSNKEKYKIIVDDFKELEPWSDYEIETFKDYVSEIINNYK